MWHRLRLAGAFMFLVALVTGIYSCSGGKEFKSNLDITQEEAKDEIDFRLKEQNKLRFKLNLVYDAMEPLDAILSDLDKALDSKSVGAASVSTFVKHFKKLLKNATRSTVDYNDDGSWELESKIVAEFLNQDHPCREQTVQIRNRSDAEEPNREVVDITLLACKKKDPIKVASIFSETRDSDSSKPPKVWVEFYPKNLTEEFEGDFDQITLSDDCEVTIESPQVDLICDPFEFKSGSRRVKFDVLSLTSKKAGTNVEIDVKIINKRNEVVLDAIIDTDPHTGEMSRRINVR